MIRKKRDDLAQRSTKVSKTLLSKLQQVLEVDVLLIRHVLQPILAVDLRPGLVEVLAHGVIDRVPGDTRLLALVCLLFRFPADDDDLEDDDAE